MAHVEDRWMKTGPTGRKVKSDRHGTGRRWLAVWTEPDGSRRKKAFTVKDAAQAHLDSVSHELRAGTYVSPDRGRIAFRGMADRWLNEQAHQRASSITNVRHRLANTILPTLGDTAVADLERGTIQAAVTAWSRTLAPSTVKVAYVYTAGILKLAVDERRIAQTPCRKINLPAVERSLVEPLRVAEVQALIDALWAPYKPLAVFIAASGVRGGGARGLTWDRVEALPNGGAKIRIDRQLLTVAPTWGPPKTASSARTISVGAETLTAMGQRGEGLVFANARGKAMSRNDLSGAWCHAAKASGAAGAGWHALRHFHASLLIAGGSSPVAVASRLGHKDATETLQTYAHLWHDDDDKMAAATDGLVMP